VRDVQTGQSVGSVNHVVLPRLARRRSHVKVPVGITFPVVENCAPVGVPVL
jgi:hypothetical protein